MPGGERYGRTQRLASLMGWFGGRLETATREKRSDAEAGEALSLLARGLATHLLRQEGVKPQQIRCRRHVSQDIEAPGGTAEQRDPFSESYFQEVYLANTIVMSQGQVEILSTDQKPGDMSPPDKK